jgi:hypothetical protein
VRRRGGTPQRGGIRHPAAIDVARGELAAGRGRFAKLDIDDLPQHQKRTELAQRALAAGLVTPRDLAS